MPFRGKVIVAETCKEPLIGVGVCVGIFVGVGVGVSATAAGGGCVFVAVGVEIYADTSGVTEGTGVT